MATENKAKFPPNMDMSTLSTAPHNPLRLTPTAPTPTPSTNKYHKPAKQQSLLDDKVDWKCNTCTYMNTYYKSYCDICAAPKCINLAPIEETKDDSDKSHIQKQTQNTNEWRCNICTLLNPHYKLMCDACGEMKYNYNKLSNNNQHNTQTPQTPPSTSLPLDYDGDSDSHNSDKWKCGECNTCNQHFETRCLQCHFMRDHSVRKGKNLNLTDWICTACNFENDSFVTRQHDIPCCLKCGTPNLEMTQDTDNDSVPPLETVNLHNGFDSNNLPRLQDWQCNVCNMVNKAHTKHCEKCFRNDVEQKQNMNIDDAIHGSDDINHEIKFQIDSIDDEHELGYHSCGDRHWRCDKCQWLNDGDRIMCIGLFCGNINTQKCMEREYKYNELDESEQQCLVEGYCRRYSGIKYDHGLWQQTVAYCFGCYVGKDVFDKLDNVFYHKFVGRNKIGVAGGEGSIYSWRVRITSEYNVGNAYGNNDIVWSVLVGLMDCKDGNIEYCINDRGTKHVKHGNYGLNDSYCKLLELGDIIVIRYDKSAGTVSFGVNDKWYGVAFDKVIDTEYQLTVTVRLANFLPHVELLDHHIYF